MDVKHLDHARFFFARPSCIIQTEAPVDFIFIILRFFVFNDDRAIERGRPCIKAALDAELRNSIEI